MNTLKCAVIGATFLFSNAALAGEISGGSIGLSYSSFTEDSDFSRIGVEGSIEYAFNRDFSVQGDLAFQNFGESDLDSTTFGAHGIYHVNDDTSLGAFFMREDVDDGDGNFYGIEGGYETGQVEFEGYAGNFDGDGDNATILGISGRYEFSNALGLTGSFDQIDGDGVELSRYGVKLDRDVSPTLNLFVEVGSADVEAGGLSGSETFVGLGGKIVFGAERGATFEQRGLTRLIPGL